MAKSCPFNSEECNKDCALFVDVENLNESMSSKLTSLGILNKDEGVCSLKVIAMSSGRYIYEHTITR